MRIAMISYYLPSQDKIGSGYQAHYMANALARRGHSVTLFAPVPKPTDALYTVQNVPVGKTNRIFRFARNLAKIDFSSFDILHAHGDDYYLFTHQNPPHIRTMHGSCLAETLHVPGLKEKLRMFMLGLSELLAVRAADKTVAVSTNTIRSYPWIKKMIPNGVDTSAFYPCEDPMQQEAPASDSQNRISKIETRKSEAPTILFVGTYHNRKRGKLLVEAFTKTIRPALPSAKLWMVCSDVPAPIPDGVEMLGKLSTPDLADRYRRAWAFCLPSSYEGFGVPYIEAMASGTPVVATPNPGSTEVLAEGKYGLLTNDDQLGQTLLNLLQSPEQLAHFRAAGLERSQTYAWNNIAAQYESLYAELISKKSKLENQKSKISLTAES